LTQSRVSQGIDIRKFHNPSYAIFVSPVSTSGETRASDVDDGFEPVPSRRTIW